MHNELAHYHNANKGSPPVEKVSVTRFFQPEGFNVSSSGKILKVHRFRQSPGECSIAASAAVAHYYNKSINYKLVSHIAENDGDGLYTPDIGILLNRIGFTKVTIISADVNHFDFTWKDFTKEQLISELKHCKRYNRDKDSKEIASAYVKFLCSESNENSLIIDHRFGDYIRASIDEGEPVMVCFNFNIFHEIEKWDDNGEPDPRKGHAEEHEVVVSGYDDEGVYIVDSHHELYTGKLRKYRNGRYKMKWETLMTVMGLGDVIIPSGYLAERAEHGLVQKK